MKSTYDARGALTRVDDTAGGTFTFDYNLSGSLLSSTGPFGAIDYLRDELGRVSRRHVIGQPAVTYSYDPVGNLLSATMPQASMNISYDARNRPSTLSRANGVTSGYSFDPAGRLLSIVHARGATNLQSLTYAYDVSGNRINQQTSLGQPLVTQPATATYDDANRLIQRAGATFTYDDTGNLISESGLGGNSTYTWDSRNRLKSIVTAGQRTDFDYDFAGSLVRQTDSGSTLNRVQTFVLDAITNIAFQSATDGNSFSVLTGESLDSHWATVSATGQVEYALTDAINSTIETVTQTGDTKGRFSYEPFGQTTVTGSSFPFQYTGRVPVNSNLYYYRARLYDPTVGRFLGEDSRSVFDSDNLYVYVANNAINLVDPLGYAGELLSGGDGALPPGSLIGGDWQPPIESDQWKFVELPPGSVDPKFKFKQNRSLFPLCLPEDINGDFKRLSPGTEMITTGRTNQRSVIFDIF